MKETLKEVTKKSTDRLSRYREILRFLIRHGGKTFLQDLKFNEVGIHQTELEDGDLAGDPESLAEDLEALGPTFIKLGQALSMRPDLLPTQYQDALSKLQDKVAPFSFAQVEKIVESELNVRLGKVFAEFDENPLAAASLGQVHSAKLRDGRQVVVKIQRPNIQKTIISDLEDLRTLAKIIENNTDFGRRLGLIAMLDQFQYALLQELDYEQETQNLKTFAKLLANYDDLVTPTPIYDFCTDRVLTMTYVDGQSVSKLSGFQRLDLDVNGLTSSLCKAYLDQILVHGFVHADPHPGNVLLTKDQNIALLDLGMVAYIDPDMRARLLRLLLAMSENRGEAVAEICVGISTPLDDADIEGVTRKTVEIIGQYQHAPVERREVGRTVLELVRAAADNNVRPAAEIILLGKTLLYLDQIARVLAPEFNPDSVIRRHCGRILERRLSGSLKPNNIMSTVLDTQILVDELPKKVNKIVGSLAENRFKIDINSVNANALMESLEKIANRISAGLVLAALIIGAALLMSIKTSWTIFDYPALAIILFVIAAIGGFLLVIDALIINRHKSPDK